MYDVPFLMNDFKQHISHKYMYMTKGFEFYAIRYFVGVHILDVGYDLILKN